MCSSDLAEYRQIQNQKSGFVDIPSMAMFMKYIKQSPNDTADDASLVYFKDFVAVSDFPVASWKTSVMSGLKKKWGCHCRQPHEGTI